MSASFLHAARDRTAEVLADALTAAMAQLDAQTIAASIVESGYAVIDGVLGCSGAEALCNVLKSLDEAGDMRPGKLLEQSFAGGERADTA